MRTTALCLIFGWFASLAGAQDAPASLADLVLGASHRERLAVQLDGVEFRALARRPQVPFVLWPADGAEAPLRYEREAARRFLERSAAELGFAGLELRDAGTTDWRLDEVWNFELVRGGVPVFDARVQVHWRQGQLVGLVNDIPAPIVDIDARGAVRGRGEWVFIAVPRVDGFSLQLGELRRTDLGDRIRTEIVSASGGRSLYAGFSQASAVVTTDLFIRFKEFIVPAGTFPDQIDLDSEGKVWLSQPLDNLLTRFSPGTETWLQIPTGGMDPDGLDVDSADHVWTGLYSSGQLGRYNPSTGKVRRFATPYSPSNPAIPTESGQGTVWVTDHIQNRISEFDPVNRRWLQSLVMPTPASWVVEGHLEEATGDIYFSCYSVDRLAVVTPAGSLTDFPVSSGGPAFPVVHAGVVYYSLWNRDRLGGYDIATGTVTEWSYPVAGESGGPIDKTPDGRIVVGTRNRGYIMVFDPVTQLFDAYQIPTPNPGLKDGLVVAPNGVIWFTETGVNKLAKLQPK